MEVLPKVAVATTPSPSKYRSIVGHNMQLGLLPKVVAALTPFSYENHSTAILWAPLAYQLGLLPKVVAVVAHSPSENPSLWGLLQHITIRTSPT